MRLERWLAIGAATLLLAGAAAGVALAASGHRAAAAPFGRQLELHGTTKKAFVRATATYLGVEVATLQREVAAGRTLAELANATPGRSEHQLVSLLVDAAAPRIQQIADMALSSVQMRSLHTMLRRRIAGFLHDTCPLSLGGLEHLGGCAGM